MAKAHRSSIEFRHLRYFLAAAEQGSFRKAGRALGVQVSTISRRIGDLEDNLGASLFHRHSAGARLTFAGQRFLQRAREIDRQIGESGDDIAMIGRAEMGVVRIGIFSSLSSGFLPDLLRQYDQSHAAVQMELVDGNPADHVSAIRQLELDIAFVTGTRDWPDCDSEHFWSERVFAVLPEAHPLSRKTALTWHDLAGEMFIVSDVPPGQEIHDYLVQRLATLGHHPNIQSQQVDRHNLLSLVAIGRGLTVTSEATIATQVPDICYRPIKGEVLPFSAVWSPKNDNPALRRLLSLAKTLARASPP
ncbi:LysR family transcriptional regulator [Labrys okinawensis]|uniref:LysR family transcriptional regulator n=1 Tax=Labrys okinawensis TaxID=346911 RepID=UPI0039BCFD5D